VREGLPFAWTYTYNVFEAMHVFIYSKMIGHFWSLCVEEQVYLVWPFVIYFCPPDKLKGLLGGLVLLGPLVRLATWLLVKADPGPFNEHADMTVYVLTPSHVDAFALGARTALFPPRRAGRSFALALASLAVAGAVVMWFSRLDPIETHRSLGYPVGLAAGYAFVWGYSLLNACTALCIDCLTRRQLLPRFFESKPMAALGKVSYGIYMFHFPLQAFVGKVVPARMAMARMPLQVVTSIGLASLSYALFESRFLGLKSRLPSLSRDETPARPIIVTTT
jgi:peptidoglycan/LPS O-acetylase OafA/YrhL